jgi:hypothetical protein
VDEGDVQRKVGDDTREIARRLYHDDRVLRGLWWGHSTCEPTSFQFAGGIEGAQLARFELIFNTTTAIRAGPGRASTDRSRGFPDS